MTTTSATTTAFVTSLKAIMAHVTDLTVMVVSVTAVAVVVGVVAVAMVAASSLFVISDSLLAVAARTKHVQSVKDIKRNR